MKADINLDIGRKTFSSGLVELIAVLTAVDRRFDRRGCDEETIDRSWKRGADSPEIH
jgi:hypothetical protein